MNVHTWRDLWVPVRLRSDRRRDRRALERQRSQPATYRWRTLDGFIQPGECRGHLATTAHIQAAYPFVAQKGLTNHGVFIGPNLFGGPFAIDPWVEYQAGGLHDPNMLVIGLKGRGKSALGKTWALRQNTFGRRVEVIDRKSEWRPTIEAMGGAMLMLRPGERVNPLERVGSRASRHSLLRHVNFTLLGRELKPDEQVGLSAVLDAVDQRYSEREIIIPDVVEELRDPCLDVARELNLVRPLAQRGDEEDEAFQARAAAHHRQARDQAAERLSDCMLVLRDLSIGPLRDMFDGPTTGKDVWDNDAVGIDISEIANTLTGTDENRALALTMVCVTAFLDGRQRERPDGKKTIRINDEAWRALSVPGMAEYYTSAVKLARKTGIMHIIVLHKLADLSAASDTGTRTQKLAEGLTGECAIQVVYCQDEHEAPLTARSLQLTSTEEDLITQLPEGDALWRIGGRGFLVRHQIAASEWDLVQTDEGMGERTPRTVGA